MMVQRRGNRGIYKRMKLKNPKNKNGSSYGWVGGKEKNPHPQEKKRKY